VAVCVDEQCYPALAAEVPLVGLFFERTHLELVPVDYPACVALYPSLGGDPGTISPTYVAEQAIEREDGYTVYYDYDAKHQLTGERHLDGEEVYAWEWDYDAAGNREHQVFNGEATYYEYNAANELLTETTGEETTYYDYDACGNTTVKQEPSGTTYYRWDHENLMTRLDLPDGGHNYFAYDADSKRVSKRDADGFTEFIYQGPDMLALQMERDESENTRVRYTMGAGLEAMRRASNGIASGDSSFYHFDWLGSTFELTDESQAVTDEYLYNAWGEVLDRTGTTENPHQWVGRERYRAEAQLLLLGLRSLAGRVARFWSRDSGREGNNWYTYCSNLPTSCSDPSGLWKMNKVHYENTRYWARNTHVHKSRFWVRPTQSEADTIGNACRKVDEDHDSRVATTENLQWHFDFPEGSLSRHRLYSRYLQKAIDLGHTPYLCEQSARALGTALHPRHLSWPGDPV
jgi:RHS repeat-associated protein